jgi:hypothetical protein
MGFTAQSVIDLARLNWRENATGDTLQSSDCLLWLNQGVIKIRSKRNDALYDAAGEYIPYSGVSTAGTTIPMDEKFQLACAFFLTAMGYSRQSDLQNFKAKYTEFMALFDKELITA